MQRGDGPAVCNCCTVLRARPSGPNGAILYAMEYLQENFDWLEGPCQLAPGPPRQQPRVTT